MWIYLEVLKFHDECVALLNLFLDIIDFFTQCNELQVLLVHDNIAD